MSFRCALLCSFLAAFAPLPAFAVTWNPDPALGNVELHRHLYEIGRNYLDNNFDPQANLVHQKQKDHIIRESTYYAFGLLLTGDFADRDLAQKIIKRVVASQDTRAHSDWRGAFPWRAEESWETMKNPDLNSAAFVGAALAEIADLDNKQHTLDPDVRKQVDDAGKLAVGAIMRRNVDPGYTNIALLSTGLAAAGAKLWAVPGAGKFAETKLGAVLALADDGAIYEYSCPTYSAVDLSGAYTARQFAFSDAFAAKADTMINHLWNEISLSYHAPSYQLAGPYNRAYGNDMLTYAAGLKYWLYLALDGDYPLPAKPDTGHGLDQGGLVMLATTPVKPRPEFKQTPPAWREWTAVGPNDGVHPIRHLFQYREGNFVLGTVAFQDEWKQKRNLVADWRSDAPAPDNFRVGFCIDESNETLPSGFPWARIHFYSQQKGAAALVALVASTDVPQTGGWSLMFDTGAKAVDAKVTPLCVQDGAITAYLYPVSIGPVDLETKTDEHTDQHTFQVNRPWSSADAIGGLHVLSYLIVFRPSDKPAPAVSDLALKADASSVSASAKVDGADLSLLFKN